MTGLGSFRRRRRGVIDHVFVDRERLDRATRRCSAGMYSQRVAGRGIERPDAAAAVAAARRRQVHHAAMHERNRLDRARWQLLRPRARERADVAAVDLRERAEALRVVACGCT